MSKFRPLDSNCNYCDGVKSYKAQCWVSGEMGIDQNGRRYRKFSGYWKMRCDHCKFEGVQYP